MRAGRALVATILAVVLAAVVPPAPTSGMPPAGAVQPDLSGAVAAALPEANQVHVRREAGGWAFGTAVAVAPESYPSGWLWIARRDGARWQVAPEGTAGFALLSRQAPVLAPAERRSLSGLGPASEQAVPDYRNGVRLPFAVGQSWRYTGGPHPMGGGVWSSIDLAGGDGRVLAARDGLAYVMCGSGKGWLRVVHDRGFATDYYHLERNISADGRPVSEGDFLGYIGVDVSCGGRATGPHVHFALRRHGEYVAIDRYSFGKWSIRAGGRPYQGYARHGSTRVNVGGQLPNHGALGRTEGVVDTNGGGVLNQRSGPGTGHEVVGTLPDGETVEVACSARGTSHTGRGNYTTDMWNRLTDGIWISDAYLWTGTGGPVNGWCD